MLKDENVDLNQQIQNNYLLQMVDSEHEKGLKSINCSCGKMTALLEKQALYQPNNQTKQR